MHDEQPQFVPQPPQRRGPHAFTPHPPAAGPQFEPQATLHGAAHVARQADPQTGAAGPQDDPQAGDDDAPHPAPHEAAKAGLQANSRDKFRETPHD
jgi:hypothetical protein